MQIQKIDVAKTNEPYLRKNDQYQSSSYSPRRLIKQVALESPPNQNEYDNNTIYNNNKCLKMDNQSMYIILNYINYLFIYYYFRCSTKS